MKRILAVLALFSLCACNHVSFTNTRITLDTTIDASGKPHTIKTVQRVHTSKTLAPWAEASLVNSRNIVHPRDNGQWDVAADEKTNDLKENAAIVAAIATGIDNLMASVVQGIIAGLKK